MIIAKTNGRFDDQSLKNAILRTSKSTKDDVINFMSEHNITFTDKDASGNTIFYYSIVAKKNDIFDAAVEQSDLNQLYYYKHEKVTPIQLAVLTVNDYAVTKLINSGESLVSDKNQNIGKMVVTYLTEKEPA